MSIAHAQATTNLKRASTGAEDCSANKKRRAGAAATSATPPVMPWMAPPWMAPPPFMMMPPFMPPPFMAMQACMMMQMQMQAMQAHAAAEGKQPAPIPEPSKPTPATAAAEALGLPEGLPQYPAFPLPQPAPFAFPAAAAAAAHSVFQAQPKQQKQQAAESLAALPAKDLVATNLSDKDFAAFIDSFVSDGPSPADLSSEGNSSSSDEDFCLDDLLPLDSVLAHDIAAGESAATHAPAVPVASQAASLLDLDDLIGCDSANADSARVHDHQESGEDLIIFDGAASEACEASWIFAA